jgi:hypothetical protein
MSSGIERGDCEAGIRPRFVQAVPNEGETNVEPWKGGETPEEQAARREAYERLVAAFRRAGVPLERLGRMLGQVARNEAETRDFLRDQVYGVPDDMLDDLVRIRMADLDADGDEDGDGERGGRA